MSGNVRGKKERGIVKKTGDQFRGLGARSSCRNLSSGDLQLMKGSCNAGYYTC